MKFKSLANKSWYCNSEQEPVAIVKNLFSSKMELLPQPSAMLVGINDEERLICDTSPYTSSFGKEAVAL